MLILGSNPWSLSGMKTEFSGYGYGGGSSGVRNTGSHLSPYNSLPAIPVKTDLLSPPPYSQYPPVPQFGETTFSQKIFKFSY
jgi:hypothetical protein